MLPGVGKLQPRAGNKTPHGPGDENFAAARHGRDPRADMNSDTAELVADPLALSGVHSRSNLEVELTQRPTDRTRAAHRRSGAFEAGKEPVTRRVELATTKPFEQVAHARVVLVEEHVPAVVTQRASALRRADDVREQNRRKETVRRRGGPHAGQELLDLCDHRLDVAGPEGVVVARQLDETG